MARIQTLLGYRVEQYDSPNKGGAMSGHKGPVMHIAEGYYRGTINWQMNPDQRYANGASVNACSTWVIGKNPGEVAQMVDSDLIAWCQRSGSRDRSSIELAGFTPAAPTEWQIRASAEILLWEHRTYGVPLQVAADDSQRGLGHHSMDREWLGIEWGHEECPGVNVISAKPAIVKLALAGGDDMFTDDDRLALQQALAIGRAQRWGLVIDRAGFIAPPVSGDPEVWDYGGGMGENAFAKQIAKLATDVAEVKARPPVVLAESDLTNIAEKVVALLGRLPTLAEITEAVLDEQARRLAE